MTISSSSLIHFTQDKESLLGILESNFKVYNCKESISFSDKVNDYRIPMVSFCDIPLSQIKEHISKYGKYGIGLTKEWGIRKRLNPVLYIAQNSFIAESYETVLSHFLIDKTDDPEYLSGEQKALLDVLRYLKNYEGTLTRKGQTTKNYRFSDEREWRYVPSVDEDCQMIVSEFWYKEPENKKEADTRLNPLKLSFDPNDIKHIIIDNDSEINEFVDHLKKVKGKNYTLHDIERLTRRILTCEQIRSDI